MVRSVHVCVRNTRADGFVWHVLWVHRVGRTAEFFTGLYSSPYETRRPVSEYYFTNTSTSASIR